MKTIVAMIKQLYQFSSFSFISASVAELVDAPDFAFTTSVKLLLITVFPFSYMRIK